MSIALKVSVAMSLLVVTATLLVFVLTKGGVGGRTWILVTSIGILAAAIVFTYVLDRIVTKPVLQLSETATRMAAGSFENAVPQGRSDEVGDLALAMEELRRSFLAQKTELEDLNAQLEEKLVRTERLAMVGRLAGGVAHEINNPTGVILTRAEFLLETADEEKLSDDAREDLDAIRRNAQRIARITGALLSFSRQTPTEMAAVNLAELVDDALELVSHPVKHNSIDVVKDIPGDLPLARGDRARLEQVLVNLMKNAVDAMIAEGEGTMTVSGAANGNTVAITVRDTGPGLPRELRDQIFEPFFTTKEVGKGTGLGLSISYGIMADHDGEIRLDSKPGEGAAFTATLPVWGEGGSR